MEEEPWGKLTDNALGDIFRPLHVLPGGVCAQGSVLGLLRRSLFKGPDETQDGYLDCYRRLGVFLPFCAYNAFHLLHTILQELVS
jgi:hypothetical protein